jgi:hypothetical protein
MRSRSRSRDRDRRDRDRDRDEVRTYRIRRVDDRTPSQKRFQMEDKDRSMRSTSHSGSGADDSYGHFEGKPGEMITDRCTYSMYSIGLLVFNSHPSNFVPHQYVKM